MELYLQFGSGMMEHCRHLITSWGGGTAVLSPRDLDAEQLPRFSASINGIDGGNILIDPQFYLPHADHERLCSHDYWPDDYASELFWQGPPLKRLLTSLQELNTACGTRQVIIPGLFATRIDDDWLATQSSFLEEAQVVFDETPILSTIALSADAGKDQAQITTLLEASEQWNPHGYYLVCEHPGDYLVEDPNWLANVLDVIAGFRIQGKDVIVGYATHQLLSAAAANATAICSGTWLNVRSFGPDKFTVKEEDFRRRAKWYYCPQALSEYKPVFLDIAQRQGLLDSMKPLTAFDGGYVDMLFSGIQPSNAEFSEQSAFRHYLHALHEQVAAANADTFDDAVSLHEQTLESAEQILETLAAARVSAQQRDFTDIIDVNRAALAVLSGTRGAMLRRRWSTL